MEPNSLAKSRSVKAARSCDSAPSRNGIAADSCAHCPSMKRMADHRCAMIATVASDCQMNRLSTNGCHLRAVATHGPGRRSEAGLHGCWTKLHSQTLAARDRDPCYCLAQTSYAFRRCYWRDDSAKHWHCWSQMCRDWPFRQWKVADCWPARAGAWSFRNYCYSPKRRCLFRGPDDSWDWRSCSRGLQIPRSSRC